MSSLLHTGEFSSHLYNKALMKDITQMLQKNTKILIIETYRACLNEVHNTNVTDQLQHTRFLYAWAEHYTE